MNEIIIDKEISYIVINNKYGEIRVIIDTEDLPRVCHIHWNAERDSSSNKFYIRNRRLNMRLHRVIMNCPDEMVVDHINHNTLDNRKANLRICTTRENNANTNLYNNYPNKSTGIYGISIWKKKYKRKIYEYFKVQFKDFKIKVFKDLDKAIEYLEECKRNYKGKMNYDG